MKRAAPGSSPLRLSRILGRFGRIGLACGRLVLFRPVVAEHGLKRANSEDRAFVATRDNGNGADGHDGLPTVEVSAEYQQTPKRRFRAAYSGAAHEATLRK